MSVANCDALQLDQKLKHFELGGVVEDRCPTIELPLEETLLVLICVGNPEPGCH